MSKRMISVVIVVAGILMIAAVGFTIAVRAQQATTAASQPTLAVAAPAVATSSPLSDSERIRNELLSLGLAIERVDFQETMPPWLSGDSQTKPDVAFKLNPARTLFERMTATYIAEFLFRYEAQSGVPITSFSIWLRDQEGSSWTRIDTKEEAIDTSTPTVLDDTRATEAVREVLNLTSDEAHKYVNVSVTTLKLSKTQRQIARIEVQDSPEAREWLARFGGDAQSPQRVIIERLGDIAKLNSQDDIEIIFAGLSVPNVQNGKDFGYFRKFYLPPALYGDVLNTNDPLYFPHIPPSGPSTAMPTVLPHMLSPLPTPATP